MQIDFEVYSFIFLKIEDFKISFQILKIISQPIIRKIILKKLIQFESGETIYIQVNYIDLSKRRSFIITTIYLTVVYTVLDNNTPKIAILANPTKKRLELSKNIRLKTIYKCVNTIYIIIDISKAFVIMAIASSIFSDLFSAV